MIEAENLGVSYEDESALTGVNLTIRRRSSWAVIGPSGCGKTTLIYALAGLLPPATGSVRVKGEELTDIRRSTGVVLQEYGLLPWKTVWHNVALGPAVRGEERGAIRDRVDGILRELNIREFAERYPAELSGGQRQRVAIGRALAIEPDLLLLDEPFSSLDALTRERLQELLLEIFRSRELTILLVTHNIDEAVFLGERIAIMSAGRIERVVDNEWFGTQNLRQRREYYDMCRKVRRELTGVIAGAENGG